MAPVKRTQSNSQKHGGSSQRKSITQRKSNELTPSNTDQFSKRLVRYVLIKGGSTALINKADIKKAVLNKPSAPNIKFVMKQAKKILSEVYGYKLQKSVNTKTQYYFLCYKEPHVNLLDDGDKPKTSKDTDRILLMLILVHIFMSDNICTEESLQAFLQKMQIDSPQRRSIFGNIGEYMKTLTKQKYLEVVTHHDKMKYKWGPKAECTFSKEEILNFMSEIYKRPIGSWPKGLEAAAEQKDMLQEDSDSDASVE